MRRISILWKANAIAFISSFCVMVIELIAGRILAPYIGVSLYTWTSIIGVILAGIALGNYLGGKIADRYPSPMLLAVMFFVGGLATVLVLPATKMVASAHWLANLPVTWNFTLKTSCIFLLPAIILSMVSPLVIKLTLADLGQTGGVVGTIYAFSTAGAILGTFMTGFFFILWFGTRTIVWLVAVVLVLTGILVWFCWRVPVRWKLSAKNLVVLLVLIIVSHTSVVVFFLPRFWQESYTKESNYYAIQVYNVLNPGGSYKELVLDHLVHSKVVPNSPTTLRYEYLNVFDEIVRYVTVEKQALRVLHLGGGGYAFPRYLEAVYPRSVNEVVEIDPAVTQVAHEELGLPVETSITTYNQDARLFLIRRKMGDKYDIVIGDVFNDLSTPYHLTTLEFDKLIKANMEKDGIYLINIIDDYRQGRYMSSFIHTLRQAFDYVYLFCIGGSPERQGASTFVIAATDRRIDLDDYRKFVTIDVKAKPLGNPIDEVELDKYLAEKAPILLTDDYVPTDILVAPLTVERYKMRQAAVHYERGKTLAEEGRYDEAITDFSKAIELNPSFAEAYCDRGRAYGSKGQYDEAIIDFDKAIELNFSFAPAYYYRGIAYGSKGQYDEAIIGFGKAIELNFSFAEVYFERGRAYGSKRQHDDAITDFSKAIELNPSFVPAYNYRGVTYGSKGQHDRAIIDFSKAIELNPSFAPAYYYRGVSYYYQIEDDKAVIDFSKAIELNPSFMEAYFERGRAYYAKGERDNAVADFKKVTELSTDPARTEAAKYVLERLGQ